MEVRLRLSEGQKKKLSEAATAGTGCTLQLKPGDYHGEHVLRVPERSAAKITKMAAAGKGMRLVLSKSTVAENKKVIGGFIGPLLAGLAGAVLPGLVGSIFGSDQGGEGMHLHGEPPAVGVGMFQGEGARKKKKAGEGMFLHGSSGPGAHLAVPTATGGNMPQLLAVEGEGVKKSEPESRKVSIIEQLRR